MRAGWDVGVLQTMGCKSGREGEGTRCWSALHAEMSLWDCTQQRKEPCSRFEVEGGLMGGALGDKYNSGAGEGDTTLHLRGLHWRHEGSRVLSRKKQVEWERKEE